MDLETKFKIKLKKEIKKRLPGCIIVNLDPSISQGVPDHLILFNDRWAALEVKRSYNSPKRPNQQHYVEMLNVWSFAAFVYPENMEEVLDALQRSLEA